jgi:hypothetical protein
MQTAAKVLIVGGTLNLALAFGLGFVLSQARLRGPRTSTVNLLQAHRVALWEGFMLLGLTFAVLLSPLSATTNTLAAGLLVASSAFQDASSIVNWLQGVKDEFAQRSPGFQLAVINALLASVGLAILIYGVFRGL